MSGSVKIVAVNIPLLSLAALLSLSFAALLCPCTAFAQDGRERLPEAARRSLAERGFPWYDAEQDDLQRLDVDAEDTEEDIARNRSSDWKGEPTARSGRRLNTGWLGAFRYVLNILLWGVLLCLLLGLLYLLIRFLLKRERMWSEEGAAPGEATATVRAEAEQFDNLPFDMARPQGNLLDEAKHLYEQGNYQRAIIYLFSYELMHLDRHQMIHLSKGKTNRQYLRELRWQPAVAQVIHQTMIAFEDAFFGDRALTREEFETCWNQLDTFHRHVEQSSEQTAAA